jgi:hypothetical protein
MGHLTGARTERKINSIEVVSDDSQRVLRFSVNENGSVTIASREAIESDWDAKPIAIIDKDDAAIVATILNGGGVSSYSAIGKRIEAVSVSGHTLPKPEEVKGPMDGDCTPLDIERAKAANLKEERELVQLQMERDHQLDHHVRADVPGCPACERKFTNADAERPAPIKRPTDPASFDDVPF